MNKKVLFYRVFLYIVGINLLCAGIGFLINTGLGTSSWDSINVGLSERFSISVGTALICMNLLVVTISFILSRKVVSFLSIMTGIIEGVLIDFWNGTFISKIDMSTNTSIYVYFIIGLLLMGIGVGMYIHSKLPINHIDLLMVTVSEKFNVSLSMSKWIIDGIALVFGFLLQGKVTIGTILILLFFGPVIQFFAGIVEKTMDRVKASSVAAEA